MAHLGKIFERHFRRDLGYSPVGFPFEYLGKRYQFAGNGFTPWPTLRFVSGVKVTSVGSWDEASATMIYHYDDPGTFTPGLYLRLEYILTRDENFYVTKLTLGKFATDMVYGFEMAAPGRLEAIGMSGPAIYIPPFTGPYTAYSPGLKGCRWANAPP